MCAAVGAVDHKRQVLTQLVGEVFVDDAANDRRCGRSVVNLETYRIAVMALGSHRLLHGTHDVAALAQVAQGRLQAITKFPDAR